MTFKPKFPSISGTSFGIVALCHIIQYVGKKNTYKGISEYMRNLHKHECSANNGTHARRSRAFWNPPYGA